MNTKESQEMHSLLEQAVAGDKAALEAVLESVQDLVFNLSLRMLGTSWAPCSGWTAASPGTFWASRWRPTRQRLSRARRRMADFLSEYCGAYGSGACRCAGRVNYAIQNRRISPQHLDFTAARPARVVLDVKTAMEEIDDLSFSFCRTYQSPEELKQFVQDFLRGPTFSAVTKA